MMIDSTEVVSRIQRLTQDVPDYDIAAIKAVMHYNDGIYDAVMEILQMVGDGDGKVD